ncbi:MAG: hypothetical protein BWX59_02465 [Bacteroidetes bacterium ADurb.Bin028]|nr:MAG: hypothetical protein BWX59_02465 [Bacteroidetes bacterium ADurb.Bin028]
MSNEIVLPVFDTITMYEIEDENGNTVLSLFNSKANNELDQMATSLMLKVKDVLIEMGTDNVSMAEAVFKSVKNNNLKLQDLFEITCLFIYTTALK